MQGSLRYVIFTGANERAIIATCRYFRKEGIQFSLIARPGKDKIKLTHYKCHIDAERKLDTLDHNDMSTCVISIKNKHPNDILHFVPTAESINRVILAKREMFKQAGLNVALCDDKIYAQVSDKESFIQLTGMFGVNSPENIPGLNENNIPFVAKPRKEFSELTGEKIYPHLILSLSEYVDFTRKHAPEEYFFQKYIDGESYYYLMDFNDPINPIIRYQRNLLQQSQGKSIIAAICCECPDKLFEQQVILALRSVNYHGLIMVEMMKIDNESWLIEANPRLWGPFQLAIKAGIKPVSNEPVNADSESHTFAHSYLWLGGLVANIASGEKPRRYFRKGESLAWFIIKTLRHDIYLKKETIHLFFKEIASPFIEICKNKSHKTNKW